MESQRIDLMALLTEWQDTANEALPRLCGSTAPAVLRTNIDRLASLHQRIRAAKIAAASQGKCAIANALLGYECIVASMIHESNMWIALKEQAPHKAWEEFVDGEEYYLVAARTPAAGDFAEVFQDRFARLQSVLFPSMAYMSCGFDHGRGLCTVCNSPAGSCPHIKGRLYCGQICAEYRFAEVELDHVALVLHPMSKHCYLSHHRASGGPWIDRLSGEECVLADDDNTTSDDKGMTFRGVVFKNKLPPGTTL